jgi:signal transduction histidine kinase
MTHKKKDDGSISREACQEQFDRATSEFITVTAHKIHTPVAAMKWQLEMLIGGDLGEISDAQKESLQSIMDCAERLNDLSRALLYVFELEKDLPQIHVQETDLHALIARTLGNISELTKQKDVHVISPEAKEPVIVSLDPDLSFIILRTLLENAIVYSKPKGEVQVRITARENGKEISVQDFGCGIPQSLQHLLFTKFFRAPNARQIWTEGSGLNLYVAKNIVSRTGGSLSYESTEGKGSIFSWLIPARSSETSKMPWERGQKPVPVPFEKK